MADQFIVATMTFSKDQNPADIWGVMQIINSDLAAKGVNGFLRCSVMMQTDEGWDLWKPELN